MKKTPDGWPRISVGIWYDDAPGAIDWLCRAFGFEVRIKIQGEDGAVHHSELTYGEGVIMVGTAGLKDGPLRKSPRSLGGSNTQSMMVYVDDADAHCAQARAAGARIIAEPKTTDHGPEYWADRSYEVEDLEGHRWWFSQRVR